MTTLTAPAATRDAFLRLAMRLDAIGSGLVGVAGLAMASRVAELAGTTPGVEYSIGALFVVYGVTVFSLSRGTHVRVPGIAVVVGNVAFTIAAIVIVLADVWPLTTTGVALTIGSGVFTTVMADLQYLGLRRMRA